MKNIILIFPLILILFGCPIGGAVPPLSFSYTIDKAEVKGGDIIIVTADLPIFQSKNKDVKIPISVSSFRGDPDELPMLMGYYFEKPISPISIIDSNKAEFKLPMNIVSKGNFISYNNNFYVNHYQPEYKDGIAAYGYCSSNVKVIDYENKLTLSTNKAKLGEKITITSFDTFFDIKEINIEDFKAYLKKLNMPLVNFIIKDSDKSSTLINCLVLDYSISDKQISFTIPDYFDDTIDEYGSSGQIVGYLQILNFKSLNPSEISTFSFKTEPEKNVAFFRSLETLTIEK